MRHTPQIERKLESYHLGNIVKQRNSVSSYFFCFFHKIRNEQEITP